MSYRPFTNYEYYIYLSRYARWLDEEGRREEWPETVRRVVSSLQKQTNFELSIPWLEIEEAILNRDVMPSMRVMMTAGKALEENHIAAYNCSYLDIDSVEAFGEVLYVLMHGTGLGFSVRKESVNKLPAVKSPLIGKKVSYEVQDSKEGWRDSVMAAVNCLYDGIAIEFDYSLIRPEGARLQTFGGRASGPQPLIDLHDYLRDIFREAVGRKLSTREVHGIVCKIAQVVVVGGVRRSALISLSDLEDEDMRDAKAGEWWNNNSEYALANNSAIYGGELCKEDFDKEWEALRLSGSGERGIFNMESALKKFKEIGREPRQLLGTNPCGEILLRDGQFCNLTEAVVRPTDTISDLLKKVELASIIGTIQSTFDDFKGLRGKWVQNTKEERLLGVSMTGIMDNELLNGKRGKTNLQGTLEILREEANYTNRRYARLLGVNPSAAVTTVKPSGTVSQLCGTSSGIHPAHSDSYIRRVRSDYKDPLTQLLIDEGVQGDTDFYNPKAHCFEFGIRRTDSLTRNDLTAIEFLELWLMYKRHWTDHNPSVTVSVREHEWREVGEWVYDNLQDIGGLSFLPFTDHTYQQAPYECSQELPSEIEIDFSRLGDYEKEDATTDELGVACSAGVCEI